MVAIPRRSDGRPVGGIHRTFLLEDGSGKAPAGKKMLGSVADGAVRLFPIGDDGHLGIAEGIETALAAQAIFGVPVWAALSADGVARWQWPADVQARHHLRRRRRGRTAAAARLAERLTAAGIPNEIVAPLHGDDFNDDLQRGAVAADYGRRAATQADPSARRRRPPSSRRADGAATLCAELEAAAEALTNPPDVAALGTLLGRLVLARLDPLPERQVLARIKSRHRHRRCRCSTSSSPSCAGG